MKWLIISFFIGVSFLSRSQECVEGKIVDGRSNAPIYPAIMYLPDRELIVRADSVGGFKICNLEEDKLTIEVRSYGYRSELFELHLKDTSRYFILQLIPSFQEHDEIVVYGDQYRKLRETPNEIESYSSEEMRNEGALSISDGLAKQPGISQLSTGAGISKPVIRGLYGNRIQTVMLGLRFDNQQWQDEHGLGVSDVGVDRVEIIKGPASLLYGPEAMGGVINIIEERPAPLNTIAKDVSMRVFSNTFGVATDVGVKGSTKKINWRVRAGVESHADYTDGNNDRIVNTRFGGYYLKTSFGYRGKHWTTNNTYMFSMNNFGFIMDDGMSYFEPDGRQSRTYQLPHHSVYLNLVSSQNTFMLKNSMLKVDLGTQFNNRQEQEGGNKISLDMLLTTVSLKVLWEKELAEHLVFDLGSQELYQTNVNLGSRMIVPDAKTAETSVSAYLKSKWKYAELEGGIRYGFKNIETLSTGQINIGLDNPGSNVMPFNRWYSALNGALGVSIFDAEHWNFKTNVSSGFRPGNLAELSSNGLHEGTIRYEIGNTELKTERNICADVYAGYNSAAFTMSVSGYINYFMDYIYLAPTEDEYIGFQIFRYVQKDAQLKGWEAKAEYHPQKLGWLRLETVYSTVVGVTDDGENLPFIPANKLNSEIKFVSKEMGKLKNSFVKLGGVYVSPQKRPGQFETSTGDYWLFNAAIGTSFGNVDKKFTVSMVANNLLNETYYDHLSRYKYFGIYNMGRNLVLNLNYKF